MMRPVSGLLVLKRWQAPRMFPCFPHACGATLSVDATVGLSSVLCLPVASSLQVFCCR